MKTYRRIVSDLCQAYPESEARALARWVCEERFGLTQTDILLDKDNQFSADDITVVKEITDRLLKYEPIQYILGETTFCGHRFSVASGVLIPRPETEQLVGHVLRSVVGAPTADLHLLDIGTGSGCIALSLGLALAGAEVTAWDISDEALAIASENGQRYPEAKVMFEKADILQPPTDGRFWDVIVSNPPYVRQGEAAEMSANVLQYEPHTALFVPDDDALLFYRAIARFATTRLKPYGQLWFEINQYLSNETAQVVGESGFGDVRVLHDSFGNPRFLSAMLADVGK